MKTEVYQVGSDYWRWTCICGIAGPLYGSRGPARARLRAHRQTAAHFRRLRERRAAAKRESRRNTVDIFVSSRAEALRRGVKWQTVRIQKWNSG